MSKLKEEIEANYLANLKGSREPIRRNALTSIKVRMVNWEKANPGKEITDGDVVTLLLSEIKKRDQAQIEVAQPAAMNPEQLEKILSHNTKEALEQKALMEYLPKQMNEEEILAVIKSITPEPSFPDVMRHFVANHKGNYNSFIVKKVFETQFKNN